MNKLTIKELEEIDSMSDIWRDEIRESNSDIPTNSKVPIKGV
jgi:hypothetical protein